ncbi:unnamed protein product [Anisakis simplex]|uniref:RING-type E3 ubiquitin transferase n=1 Tax=Anisakis simplex TaxID=6269 RepID=A0A0M3JS66_ANISI|nr:unnamed protein product [Anisakis simplex]
MGQVLSLITRNNSSNIPTSDTEYENENCEMPRFSNRTGAFFGSHFLMGGERYEVAKPESFLFGDNSDLDLLSSKPTQAVIKNELQNDGKEEDSDDADNNDDDGDNGGKTEAAVEEEEVGGSNEAEKELFYLEFYFDCDSACYVQIHFCVKESITDGHVQYVYFSFFSFICLFGHIRVYYIYSFVSKYPNMKSSERYFFNIGAEQHFDKFVFDPSLYDIDNMHYESGAYFPVVIELCTVDCGVEQIQTTMATIDRTTDQSAALILKPLKQKLIADGVVYLLQEIYGIENKDHDLSDENGSECIICMSDIRDTVILPCRHLCICNGCAETLRYKLNNCPICRSPFRALLQLKTMRVVSTVSITDQSSSATQQHTRSQTRYETMTLVEALNGPVSHIQSCLVEDSSIIACEIQDCYYSDANAAVLVASSSSTDLNNLVSTTTATTTQPLYHSDESTVASQQSSLTSISIQQVLTLNATTRDVHDEDDNTVYIEMKATDQFSDDDGNDIDNDSGSELSVQKIPITVEKGRSGSIRSSVDCLSCGGSSSCSATNKYVQLRTKTTTEKCDSDEKGNSDNYSGNHYFAYEPVSLNNQQINDVDKIDTKTVGDLELNRKLKLKQKSDMSSVNID